MAIATGTALALGAGLGTLGGAALGARSSNRATRAQEDANRRAEARLLEQEAQRRKEYEERLAMEKAQWEAREDRKAEILARYGRTYNRRPYTPGAPSASPTSRPSTAPTGTPTGTPSALSRSPFSPETPALMPPRIPWAL